MCQNNKVTIQVRKDDPDDGGATYVQKLWKVCLGVPKLRQGHWLAQQRVLSASASLEKQLVQ